MNLRKDLVFWSEFLDLYKSFPCLWKVKSPDYKDRGLKAKCYKKMVEKLKEMDPQADRNRVVKKINVFRTNYTREFKRMRQSGVPLDKYKSSLWYFDKLKFLHAGGDHHDQGIKAKEDCVEEKLKQRHYSVDDIGDGFIDIDSCDGNNDSECLEISNPSSKHIRIVGAEGTSLNTLHQQNNSAMKLRTPPPSSAISQSATEDVTSDLAKSWASQYKELSKEQKLYARAIFADVLFQGCLGKLNEESVEEVHQVLRGNLNRTSTLYLDEYTNQ
ncbi:uncharacterized protein LOC142230285 [Haematobia irritans]|uniref:uncharacterized protein LOC142230285 n=1 Tax=Haematobia irritans TaxID=7368 RepID=UPI003F507CC1